MPAGRSLIPWADAPDQCRQQDPNAHVPGSAGKQHHGTVKGRQRCQNGCNRSPHGYLLRPRRVRRVRCDRAERKDFKATFAGAKMPEISPWQAGEDSLKDRFRTCWLSLAGLCSHSENPIRLEIIPFRTSAWIARKDEKTRRFGGMWAGVFRLAGRPRSCPRLQAPATKPKVSSMA